jgi:biopolymer transport protein ExbD
MALKRKTTVTATFSMASLTDIIFLLLIFFLITSTVVVPNAIKVTLPQAQQQAAVGSYSILTIDENLNYFVQYGRERARPVTFEEIIPYLQEQQDRDPDMYVALHAHETIPYREVVKVMDITYRNNLKMVLATRR